MKLKNILILKEESKNKSSYEEQMKMGLDVEKEHKPTYLWILKHLKEHDGKLPPPEEFYKSIAKDHLEEHSDYYTVLLSVNL